MLWGLAALLLVGLAMQQKRQQQPSDAQRSAMVDLVRAEALRQGLPPPIALAFADAESGFNANAEGDLGWADRRRDKYEELVLNDPRMKANPAASNPAAWHSYGLFQLLAPYFVRPNELPRVLLDPRVNAQRAIAHIKKLLHEHGDDLAQVRLAYTGSLQASPDAQTRVLARFTPIYQRWAEREASA